MSRRVNWVRGDDGVALIVAIALLGLATVLMVTMVSFSLREGRQTGHDRQRSSAVTTAEGGVDQMVATFESPGTPAVFPCSSNVTNSLAKPDTMTIATTVTYYDVNGVPLPCSGTPSALTVPGSATQALVSSTSTSNSVAGAAPAIRKFSSLVRLKALYPNSLNYSLFANTSIVPFGSLDINGNVGSDADVYTNGDAGCINAHGSVYAQGAINTGSCTIAVNAWAKNGVTSSSSIGGDVRVSGASATANLTGTVGGKIYVNKAGGVTPPAICTAAKCVTGAGSTADPPLRTFPVLNWDAATSAAWVANGYTVVTDDNCATADTWMAAHANLLTVPTLFRTACQTPLDVDFSMRLSNNLAVFADGGFTAKNGADYSSTDSTLRYLHLVQPNNSPAVTTPCLVDGIYFKNNASTPTVAMLLYTPCDVDFKNNSTVYGQIYSGGNVFFKNNSSLTYIPVPTYGLVGSTVTSYDVDTLYKREDQS